MSNEKVEEKIKEKGMTNPHPTKGSKEEEVIIKRGKSIIISMKRSDLLELLETNDGVSFNCKDGVHIYVTDIDMPNGSKNIMKNTANSFVGKKLRFDLNNYNTPVTVDAM